VTQALYAAWTSVPLKTDTPPSTQLQEGSAAGDWFD
jgi:hypothetical protein